MHEQLELLIMMQDIDVLLRESQNEKQRRKLSDIGLSISEPPPDLDDARRRIARKMDKGILAAYERLRTRYGHAVAPAVDEICYGCFMRMPTAFASGKDRNEELTNCPNCGRFLYWLAP